MAQVQVAWQSVSTVQLTGLAWQRPGKDETVVQETGVATPASTSAGTGVGTEPLPPPVPAEAEPPPELAVPVPPEHMPVTVGWQVKVSPQSVSTLHGNSYL
jgi:hypothetical protein